MSSWRIFQEAGIPWAYYNKMLMDSPQPITFETGNGPVECKKSVGVESPILGRSEFYALNDSPFAACMGGLVLEKDLPFIWRKPGLPWFCTDSSKLTIHCDEKYRRYADRVEENVPIFAEEFKLVKLDQTGIGDKVKGNPARPDKGVEPLSAVGRSTVDDDETPLSSLSKKKTKDKKSVSFNLEEETSGEAKSSAEVSTPVEPNADPLLSVEDVRCGESLAPSEGKDSSIVTRSMRKSDLIAEAKSLAHLASHYPDNPYSDTCNTANMRQQRFARKTDN